MGRGKGGRGWGWVGNSGGVGRDEYRVVVMEGCCFHLKSVLRQIVSHLGLDRLLVFVD